MPHSNGDFFVWSKKKLKIFMIENLGVFSIFCTEMCVLFPNLDFLFLFSKFLHTLTHCPICVHSNGYFAAVMSHVNKFCQLADRLTLAMIATLVVNKSIFCNLPKGYNCRWNLFLAPPDTPLNWSNNQRLDYFMFGHQVGLFELLDQKHKNETL